ncbi:MAG TPA: 50S ribosomal protein L11 methyltransferase [Kofleriaceae bacterium]
MGDVPVTDWLEISVPVARGEAEADEIAGLLALELPDAAAGVEVRAGEIVYWVPVARGETALADARRAVAAMAAAGQPLEASAVVSRPAAPEEEWRDAWKRYFRTVRLTRQIVVVPSWDSHQPSPDDRVIHLDPGQAFGTGAHASTRLVLEMMQELADGGAQPRRALDLGTGSGILALAAAALWPEAEVHGVDNDPVAVQVARENADANRAALQLGGEWPDGAFDLALANIQADVLTGLAEALCERLAPGGHLILSGLLSEQVDAVAAGYAARGLARVRIAASREDPAWSAAILRR